MKLTFFLFISLLIAACQPGFHRQKYTNFGHRHSVKLKEPRAQLNSEEIAPEEEMTLFFSEDARTGFYTRANFAHGAGKSARLS